MQCRQCGTEIAARALICYRCGAATTEAKYKAPPPRRQRRSRMQATIALLIVGLLALLGFFFTGG